ncbi:threonine aldolase [Defluviimonas sp. 20V17]|uniref:L-threonine aldolase n=1 Tax=Allgaiera indica TaxID=765699 RepID=A0AAN4UPQ8_9RHOB|nr:beta-eliminating lyase-related protein [Allgaiera indica]KDB03785.1 threonine aldolase [Defluviimonas sp. 20V17]GHD99939.1 L-threonine aldolase [Allgaiera indica]SDW40230.1 L-threonine aldolase [Allgaiera indica]
MFFASDNGAPVAPQVMAALVRANEGPAPSYGADAIMDGVRARIREIFEAPEAAVYLVATGTAANALSIATFCPPWGAVYCQPEAHIAVDECGAPEFFTAGAKLVHVDGPDGKIDPAALAHTVANATPVGVHHVQPAMLSLTNLTEAGTAYSVAEIAALAKVARAAGLPVHLDGARFANALVATNASPAEMTWRAGVDVLSFGGTKNGLMGVEAVVIFDPAKAWEFELRRKRAGHLFSKHRYLSAQMQAYLEDDLWLALARRANDAGQRLAAGLRALPDATLSFDPPANLMFAALPRGVHARARTAGAAYYIFSGAGNGPEDELLEARFVTSWSTTDEETDRFLSLIRG